MNVQEYISQVPENRNERFQSILTLIKTLYPQAEESMRYKMPTYELGEGWVAAANKKNYISVYTCAAHHLAGFKAKHPNIKTGTGCINFRDKDDIPLEDLKPVIKSAIESKHG